MAQLELKQVIGNLRPPPCEYASPLAAKLPPSFAMAFPLEFLLTQALRHTLMPKDKKKHSKKKDELSGDILDMAALSLKKFRKVTKQISKLSTGQKLVGGIALLAAGLTYLANQQADEPGPSPTENEAAAATNLDLPRKRKKAIGPATE